MGVPGTIGGGIYMNAGTKYGCARMIDKPYGAKELANVVREVLDNTGKSP